MTYLVETEIDLNNVREEIERAVGEAYDLGHREGVIASLEPWDDPSRYDYDEAADEFEDDYDRDDDWVCTDPDCCGAGDPIVNYSGTVPFIEVKPENVDDALTALARLFGFDAK